MRDQRATRASAASRRPSPAGAEGGASRRGRWTRLLLLVAILGVASFAAWRFGLFELRDPQLLAAAVRRARTMTAIGPLFVLVYAVVTGFGLPALPLTLAGGAIFGAVLGSVLNWLGATLGAAIAYVLARVLGRDAVRPLLGPWGERLDVLAQNGGFFAVLRLRLVPVMPFNVVSIAAGLAAIPFRAYLAATAIGIVPGTVVYTYFADSLLAGVEGASRRAFTHVAIAAVLLVAVSFAPALVRRMRGAAPTSSTS